MIMKAGEMAVLLALLSLGVKGIRLGRTLF
jgi:hypothetical protein